LDYRRANTVLQRGARNVLLRFGLVSLAFIGMAAWFGSRAGIELGDMLELDFVIGSAILFNVWLCRRIYRKLADLRVSEAGFELRSRDGRTVVPWHAIHEIGVGMDGLTIRSPGYPDVKIDLNLIPNPQPLLDVISAQRPAAIRLTATRRWTMVFRM
jgi:hypothetical protein